MARAHVSRPPAAFQDFVSRFPALGKAWEVVGDAGSAGPLDERVARLIKLGIAAGAWREGAVQSAVRKALDAGVTPAEIEQVVALAAGTLGFPATVAVHGWIREILDATPGKRRRNATRR